MKRMIKHNISLILSIVTFAAAVVVMFSSIYAWFTTNAKVDSHAVVITTSSDDVIIRDLMEVNRYLNDTKVSDKWYHSDEAGVYYEWNPDESEYVLDENGDLIPLSVANVLPNEYIDITMWYMTVSENSGTYSIAVANMDDSKGIFKETIDGEEYNHTALGVFRVGEVMEDSEGNRSVDDSSWHWLATYNGDKLADTKYDSIIFKQGDFALETPEVIGEETYYKTTFRIEMNLTQYGVLHYTTTNALSEKIVEIKSFRLFV